MNEIEQMRYWINIVMNHMDNKLSGDTKVVFKESADGMMAIITEKNNTMATITVKKNTDANRS